MQDLIKILNEINPNVNFKEEKNLVEDEILDSFDIVNLVSRIDNEFDVKIEPSDLTPENFKSAESIYKLIKKLQED